MKPAFSTSILLVISVTFLILHTELMRTWKPMLLLIIGSFFISLVVAFFCFRRVHRHSASRRQAISYSIITVFIWFCVINILWSVSEEALIHYSLVTGGNDDTGGRYFYPGNSGMGYAIGLSLSFPYLAGLFLAGISLSGLIGIPLSFTVAIQTPDKS